MLYAVQRGNKRVFLRLEVLQTTPLTGSNTAPIVSADTYILKADQDIATQIIEFAQRHKGDRLWIVAYDFNSGSAAQRLERSQQHIDTIKQALADKPVIAKQLNYFASGGFSLPGEANSRSEGGVKVVVFKD